MKKREIDMFSILTFYSLIFANDVMVYIWNPLPIVGGSGTFGHASIGVGEHYLSFGKGHAIPSLAQESRMPDNIFRFNHKKLNTDTMIEEMHKFSRQTNQYKLFGQNCSWTTAKVLEAGGYKVDGHYVFNTGGNSTSPSELRNELLSKFCRNADQYIMAVGVLGKCERKSLLEIIDQQKKGFQLIKEGVRRKTYCIVAKMGWNL